MANSRLNQAKDNKKDEFYTQLSDIENELSHYKDQFKGMTVLCNCDDPRVSNFFRYFALKFKTLGLKRLITTCYKNQDVDLFTQNDCEEAVYLIYDGTPDIDHIPSIDELDIRPLKGDGDFRSPECIELLKQADIVVTNPPFSLFREYVAQLVEYDKKFLIMGNNNALHYSEIFPLFKENKMWLGYSANKTMEFGLPDHYEKWNRIVDGKKYGKVPSITWFTNLDTEMRHQVMTLYKRYNENEYPMYYNYPAINVNKVSEIPVDWMGEMGVPDTFLIEYNPEQFELIGIGSGKSGQSIGVGGILKEHKALMRGHSAAGDLYYLLPDGTPKVPYSRIIIKRR